MTLVFICSMILIKVLSSLPVGSSICHSINFWHATYGHWTPHPMVTKISIEGNCDIFWGVLVFDHVDMIFFVHNSNCFRVNLTCGISPSRVAANRMRKIFFAKCFSNLTATRILDTNKSSVHNNHLILI